MTQPETDPKIKSILDAMKSNAPSAYSEDRVREIVDKITLYPVSSCPRCGSPIYAPASMNLEDAKEGKQIWLYYHCNCHKDLQSIMQTK